MPVKITWFVPFFSCSLRSATALPKRSYNTIDALPLTGLEILMLKLPSCGLGYATAVSVSGNISTSTFWLPEIMDPGRIVAFTKRA